MSKGILTLGIFAHANAGKTTLTEQLLFNTNVNKEIGRVDHGNTTTDSLSIERERGISVKSALVSFELDDKVVQLIDTPGHIDFSSEVERAINVLDGAILVVSAVEGIEPQTKTVWEMLRKRNIPTIIYINKIDRQGADYNRVFLEIKEKLSPNVLSMNEVNIDTENKIVLTETSAEALTLALAEIDPIIMEKYVNNEEISIIEVEKSINSLSSNSELFCVYGGSALLGQGVKKILQAINDKLPCVERNYSQNEKFSGYVYAIKHENDGKKTFIKVLNGEMSVRDNIEINDEFQKIRTLYKVCGSKIEQCEKLGKGEIGIVTGLNVYVGETLGEELQNLNIIKTSPPLFHVNVTAKDEISKLKLIKALYELNEEDPTLNFKYDIITQKLCIDLMGPLQIEILENIINERYGIIPIFSPLMIINRETPQKSGTGSACYNGVSEVEFTITPLPRGSGIRYKSIVSTDYLYAKYQKQIEKLVMQCFKQGLFGWELDDAEICLSNGKSDSVCSSSQHYNIVTPLAFMRAVKECNMMILEPVMEYNISIDEIYNQELLNLLSSLGIEYREIIFNDNICNIKGISSLKKILTLQPILIKITNGFGILTKKSYGYDISYEQNEEKDYIGYDPRNEEKYLIDMKVKPELLGKTKVLVKDKRSKRERSLERRNKRY